MGLFKRLIIQSEERENMTEDLLNEEKDNVKIDVTEESQKEGVSVTEEVQMKEELSEKSEVEELKAESAKKIRVFDTSPNEDFWFHYGPVVKNLAELREAFLQIEDELFDYHIKGEENDFERWIKDVFGYEELSEKVGNAKTRKEAYKILEEAVE